MKGDKRLGIPDAVFANEDCESEIGATVAAGCWQGEEATCAPGPARCGRGSGDGEGEGEGDIGACRCWRQTAPPAPSPSLTRQRRRRRHRGAAHGASLRLAAQRADTVAWSSSSSHSTVRLTRAPQGTCTIFFSTLLTNRNP